MGDSRGAYIILMGKLVKETTTWEDPGLDRRMILKWNLKEVGCRGMNWIDLAQDRDKWRALVTAVMNLRVP